MPELRNIKTFDKSSSKLTKIIFIVLAIAAVVVVYYIYNYKKHNQPENAITEYINTNKPVKTIKNKYEFSDGLISPDSSTQYQLDEFGEGISESDIFYTDINNDNLKDRITRNKYENGTAHFYYEYKIELNTGNGFMDITPENFRTVEGADCALTKIQFIFKPQFSIVKISRDWQESWTNPTMATKYIYNLFGDKLKIIKTEQLKSICNVSVLF